MQTEKVSEICSLAERVFEDKRPWDNLAQMICEQCYPIRASYTQPLVIGDGNFASNVFDDTPVNAREELGNTVDAMLRQGDWFRVGTGDDDRDEDPMNAKALERATMLMRKAIDDPRMQFKAATKEADHDYVSVGQPVLTVEDTNDRRFVRVRAWHPGDCGWWLDEDGKLGAMFRKVRVPVSDIARNIKQGRWAGPLPPHLQTILGKEPNKKIELLHCFAQTEFVYGHSGEDMRKYARSPWVSAYIEKESKALLHENGEPLNLYVTPRWRSFSNMTYGLSPSGLNSLGNMRMLQQLAVLILEQTEKAVDPPMVMAAEVFTRDLNMFAGGSTYVDMPEGARLQDMMTTVTTGEIRAGLELKQDVRGLIIDAWLLNKLYLPSAREMRELEVAVRTEEFRRAALPFFQPIESDYHPELLGRIFDRMVLKNIIPRGMFPPSLAGGDVTWAFTSPLNEAEGLKVFEAYQRSVSALAIGAEIDQTVGVVFNAKQAALDAMRGAGAKADWIYSGKELEKRVAEGDATLDLQRAAAIANETSVATNNVAAAKQSAEVAGLGEAA